VPAAQLVAPQVVPTLLHVVVQQLPVPVVPQTAFVHWLLPLHALPLAILATQTPDAPGFWHQKPDVGWQSPSAAQAVLQAVALAQIRWPAQAPGVPAVQVPVPLQVPPGVKVKPEQEAAAPQVVLLVG
jgi:hypothetical protein